MLVKRSPSTLSKKLIQERSCESLYVLAQFDFNVNKESIKTDGCKNDYKTSIKPDCKTTFSYKSYVFNTGLKINGS